MSVDAPPSADDQHLKALAEAAGLQSSWVLFPDEVREARALAQTYVDLLADDIDAQLAPWVFPAAKDMP